MLTEASIPHAEVDYVAAGFSDVGLQRDHNEDALCILPEHRLFVVADGMGGHRAGDVASRMATQAISSFFAATTSATSNSAPTNQAATRSARCAIRGFSVCARSSRRTILRICGR